MGLYRDRYPDLNVRRFHEKLSEGHQIELSCSWVKQALQGGIAARASLIVAVAASQSDGQNPSNPND